MKRARLRPAAKRDLVHEASFYRQHAGVDVALRFHAAAKQAVRQIEGQPGIGSPGLGQALDIPALRTWRFGKGFPISLWYFERSDHLDVVRVVAHRRDPASILTPGDDAA